MGTKDIMLVSFIACVLLYNYIGLYISHKHGIKMPWWPSIIKGKDYTVYLIYIPYIALLVNAVISVCKEKYIFWLVLLGFILMFFSMYIGFVARRDLARYWSPFASSGKEQELIKSGIYAKVRHPIYLSGLILFLGLALALIAGNLYGFLFFILYLIALGIRIRKEERELITTFGEEYKEYAKETPRLIPKSRGK